MESDTRVRFAVPPARCDPGACESMVEVSLNSESYSTSGVVFLYHNATVLSLGVASGPSSGGTRITVHGSGFMDMAPVETMCRFLDVRVVASFIDDTRLLCVSPTGTAAGSSETLSLDFSSASTTAHLRMFGHPEGCTHVASGALQLTADVLQTGSALLAVANLGSVSQFVAEFDVLVGGSSSLGDEGLSFNVGALPAMPFGSRGVRSGLSVQLLAAAQHVEVWYANALLAYGVADGRLDESAFTHVTVAMNGDGLSVVVGETLVVENVTVYGWAPSDSWSMGFGARTGEAQHCQA